MPAIQDLPGYMDAMRASFDSARAGGRNVSFQYNFTGAVSGSCYAIIADGAIQVAEGRHAAPNATVTSDFDLWLRIITYHLDMLMAYQEGMFTIEGDVESVLESDAWFRR